MSKSNFEKLEVYQLSEKLSDLIWSIIVRWNYFEKETIGKQLVNATDSIGANIAEGSGRGTFKDNKRFVKIARGSLYETKYWIKRAYKRNLIATNHIGELDPIIKELSPRLNAYLNSIGKKQSKN
ncbi:four helix bundle protein [Rhodohalobacter mucosus]|uniref:Four helix bundle protein n=1 Tax=Rhodohalobacter mucosus TaxID=2079485 RepID=A0A316TX10_9BACT|nr:four helix bundle protein [Rhodohalobacter mucosus]PWN07959.1 four helix bundle protein [Rhodohalobacter mucosus]